MPQSYDYMLDPPEWEECEVCGAPIDECDCIEIGEPDFEPDYDVSDEEADIAADRYFGDI